MDPMIQVERLVKRYKKAATAAVDDIGFEVGAGELFAFLGPNGAGKTTTISILTTTLSPTGGTATIDGHDIVREASAVRNIRLHVALYGLYAYRPFYRTMPADYRDRIEELAEVVGLGGDVFKPLKTFSGGMKRKLEIIRSLMHRPGVLFLDEPTSGLDPVSRHSLWQYLRRVRAADGTTIFLTTHYLEEAEEADRVCVIDHGRIATIGTPDELKADLLERSIVLDAVDRPALLAELRSFGTSPSIDDNGLIRVSYSGATAQSLVSRVTTPLTVLRVHDPSLEDAYVALLRQHDVPETRRLEGDAA